MVKMETMQGKEMKTKIPIIIATINQEQDAWKKEHLENKIELSTIKNESAEMGNSAKVFEDEAEEKMKPRKSRK